MHATMQIRHGVLNRHRLLARNHPIHHSDRIANAHPNQIRGTDVDRTHHIRQCCHIHNEAAEEDDNQDDFREPRDLSNATAHTAGHLH